ncbi:MAG: cytochrome b/b6 domain-containing protein [Bdellovibrionales bacterium]|nr:cytochrome b/b6 domain-containing protein [Oligoflexia bacterium]
MQVIEKHSRAIRWFHWIHFPLIMLMIWTGARIYWANQAYIEMPESVVRFFGLEANLALGMAWHFSLVWLFAINGLAYVTYLFLSGEWRVLVPGKQDFRDAVPYLLYDLHLRKAPPPLHGKFNPMQKISYFFVILMGGGALLTGLAIYKPVQAGLLTQLLGGYETACLEHFILTVGFILFFLVHVIEVMRAGWNNFRAMVSGDEIKN